MNIDRDSIIDASELEVPLKSKLSANALFNFMREYEYLEITLNRMAFLPRYYSEKVDYLELKYDNSNLDEWYIPMTCFCDIPLHQISQHAEGDGVTGYGKFAIALHKSFGIECGIQPIQYLNISSIQRRELTESLNILFSKAADLPDDDLYKSLTDYLLDQVMMVKPITGKMQNTNGKEPITITKNFHDEHEWRYIPSFHENELPYILIQEDDILASEIYTESINNTKNGLLQFAVDDIRYIFCDTLANRDRLIKFIKSKKTGKRLTKNEKHILISKILVYDEIKEDW